MSIVSRKRRRRAGPQFRPSPLCLCDDEYAAMDALLPPDHLARVIARAVNRLDVLSLLDLYAGKGSPAYQPHLLLAAVLFEAHQGFHSPAQWHRHATESLPVRWLLRGCAPSRACWYAFRDRLGPAVLDLARQAVRQAIAEGFTPARRAAADGTSLAANSTRHKMLNEQALRGRLALLERAVEADNQPPAPSPPPPAPAWMAPTAAGRSRQLRRYRTAGREMARRQQRNGLKRKSKRTPAEKILISPGDPEAAVGRDKEKVYRPLYNAQLLADLDSPLILAYDVAATPNDAGLLGGLLGQAKEGLGHAVEQVAADSAYAGGADLAEAKALGTTVYAPWQANDYSGEKKAKGKAKRAKYYAKERFEFSADRDAYVCPAGQELTYQGSSRQRRSGTGRVELRMYKAEEQACRDCPKRGECTGGKGGRSISRSEHEAEIEELRQRMKAEQAKELYRLRKQTVERLNADVKGHRGLRRLSGRGRHRAQTQLGLVVLAHDLLTLDKLRRMKAEAVVRGTPSAATG